MNLILKLLPVVMFFPSILNAQISPKENCTLNYRLVNFSFPPKNEAVNYSVEIATGDHISEDSFRKNIISTITGTTNKIIAEVPSFGNRFTWRAVYTFGGSVLKKSPLYHFSTGSIPDVDTNITRFRITNHALKFKDAYVFLDGNKVLYDMAGHPVWYLPLIEGKDLPVGDLKLTAQGTITFLANGNAYEINYDGEILWKAPNDSRMDGKGSPQMYHHEFTRLSNGHYMVLGTEFLCSPLPSAADSDLHLTADQKQEENKQEANSMKLQFGVIIEYDEQGKIVWSWKTSKYYEESDMVKRRRAGGVPFFDLHENSFYFDEKDKVVYLSCKRISRVIKIKYPEGTVINNYGDTYDADKPQVGNKLFCGQHSVKHSQQGCIFLFNNNDCSNMQPPKLKKIKEPVAKGEQLKIVWEYQCTSEDSTPRKFSHGGNITELSDESVFACMGSDYGKTFIVGEDKKVLWSGMPEKWNETDKKWIPIPQYRASIIENHKDLERLIWNTQTNDLAGKKRNQQSKIAGIVQ